MIKGFCSTAGNFGLQLNGESIVIATYPRNLEMRIFLSFSISLLLFSLLSAAQVWSLERPMMAHRKKTKPAPNSHTHSAS